MSDFKFLCPKCGQSIACDSSNAGMQIPCPTCQNVLTVPTPPPVTGTPMAPGKLSINKTAHHAPSPPPPGAAAAPPKPNWGPQPAAPRGKKKKSPVVLISVIAGVLVVAAVGWFGFGAPYLKKQAEEKQQAEEQAAKQEADAKAKAAEDAAKAMRAKADWSLDVADAKFPERGASGRIHGENFNVDAATFQTGSLTLRQMGTSPRQVQISVPLKQGEKLAGKTLQITTTDTGPQPRIVISWKEESPKPPGTQAFAKGYLLKLEFGEAPDGRLGGKIFLSLPDDAQSYVAGYFELGPKKAGATGVAGAPRPKKRAPKQPGAQTTPENPQP